MKCPKCQFAMPFQERICRRCQFCTELGGYVRTEVPRSASGRVERKGWVSMVVHFLTPRSLLLMEQRRVSQPMILVASTIPGLGQILLGRTVLGLLSMFVTLGLILTALFSPLRTEPSLVLLGLAFGIHVATVFRITTAAEGTSWTTRILTHLGVLAALALLLYSPLSDLLRNLKPQYTTYRAFAPLSVINQALLLTAQLFLISVILSWLATRFLTKK